MKVKQGTLGVIRESPYDRYRYVRRYRVRTQTQPVLGRLSVAVVTGANGFLGAHLVRALLRRGVHVRALVRPTSDVRVLDGLDVEVRRGHLEDEAFVRAALRDADVLFHLAALYSQRPEDVGALYRVNVGLVRALVKWAWDEGVSRIVHTSTIGVIGRRKDGRPPDEEEPFNLWATASHYVRSKHLGEVAALTWARMGAPVVVVNPTAPVGAFDWRPSPTGRRVLDVLAGRVPSFPPGGMNVVPARDVAEGMILAALRGRVGERYILGHLEGNLTLRDFVAYVVEAAGIPSPLPPPPGRLRAWMGRVRRALRGSGVTSGGPVALTANPRKAVESLGMPQSSLAEAFAEAVKWYRDQGMGEV